MRPDGKNELQQFQNLKNLFKWCPGHRNNIRTKLEAFFKQRQKLYLNLLIKKIIAQLIDEKPGENRYKHTKGTTHNTRKPHTRIDNLTTQQQL
jgi:hypothetical protein